MKSIGYGLVQQDERWFASDGPAGRLLFRMTRDTPRLGFLLVCGLAVWSGCSRDVSLAGRNVRSVTVRAVTHYGVTLDENATPEQVAYVLLRAIRDDFLAATPEDREAALDRQFDLCAANMIQAKNRTAVSRDEFIYNVVYRWTPTVSHYVRNFETDWENAKTRFRRTAPRPMKGSDTDATACEVRMVLDDPSGDPNAHVVMVVWLAQDSGFWRVVHLGFDSTQRSIKSQNVERSKRRKTKVFDFLAFRRIDVCLLWNPVRSRSKALASTTSKMSPWRCLAES